MEKIPSSNQMRSDVSVILFWILITVLNIIMSASVSYSLVHDRLITNIVTVAAYSLANIYGWKRLKLEVYKILVIANETEELISAMVIPVVLSGLGTLVGIAIGSPPNHYLGVIGMECIYIITGIIGLFKTQHLTD